MKSKYILKESQSSFDFKIDYKAQLNASQYEVVTQADGFALVLAGAGSGKTRTLIYRVSYLLEKGVRPDEILLVTFTNKAASEMKSRVETLAQHSARGIWCGTFHHIGNRLLRLHATHIGMRSDFGILDDEDSRDLIKVCMKNVSMQASQAKFPKPALVQSILSFSVNSAQSIEAIVQKNYPWLLMFVREFEKIKILYEEKKAKSSHLDYDDLLLKWKELLEKAPAIFEKISRQFRYVLVDEYQDTNILQHDIMRLISQSHKNLLVVGDDAQSIYSFRAARVQNILDFPEVYPGAKIYKLETNYRSTHSILRLANESIKNNVHQFPKKLKSVGEEGDLPQIARTRDMRQEAAFISQKIEELKDSGIDLSQMAVLFRAHYQAAQLELELSRRGLTYVVRGGVRFFEQAHIKDVLAHLRIIQNAQDELAWVRALTLQAGIGPGYADKIFNLVENSAQGLAAVFQPGFEKTLPKKVQDGLMAFKKITKNLLHEHVQEHPDEMIRHVLEEGYNRHVLLSFENARDRLEDLKQLINFAHTYKNLKDFLADVTLKENFKGETIIEAGEAEKSFDELVLSTIHQAKGLEWPVVFVMGLAEGQFPHEKSLKDADSLEEERRLFYVASTRAKNQLYLTHPMTRFDFQNGVVMNRPSVFIAELPKSTYDEIEIEEEEPGERTIYID